MSSHNEINHFEYEPSIEMFWNKNKMCCRTELSLTEGNYKLNFLNEIQTLGKIGFEFISETTSSKKQILDIYFTNNVVNINVSQDGKLIIRFLSDIPSNKNKTIKKVYCIPDYLHEKYYQHLPKQTSTYFVRF